MTRRTRFAFAAGAVGGLAVAAFSVVEMEVPSLAAGAAATVNGAPIAEDDFARAVAAVAADRDSPFEARTVLDRLIDEELLLQRALELGLERHDRGVRAKLVEAMIEAILAEGTDREPTRAEARAFYDEHRALFAKVTQVEVEAIRFAADRAEGGARAKTAALRLRAGEPAETVNRELGDPSVIPLPEGLLPVTSLQQYLGPTVVRAVLALAPGEVSDPVRAGGSDWVIRLDQRVEGEPPPFEEIESHVRAEMVRRADDGRLRAYLDDLRSRADVRIRKP